LWKFVGELLSNNVGRKPPVESYLQFVARAETAAGSILFPVQDRRPETNNAIEAAQRCWKHVALAKNFQAALAAAFLFVPWILRSKDPRP